MNELNYSVTNLNDVDENFRGLYTEHTDENNNVSYTLNVKGVKPEIEFNKVYNTLTKVRKEVEERDRKLNAFGDYTPDSIKDMVTELETLRTSQASTTQEDFAKRMAEAKQAADVKFKAAQQDYEKKLADLNAVIEQKEKDNVSMRLRNSLSSLYSARGGEATGLDLAVTVAEQELKWNPDQGAFYTHDGLLGMGDWIEDSLFKKYPCLMKSSLSAGARESNGSIASYKKFFDPSNKDYSEDPNSDSYKGRVECYQKDPAAARGYLEEFKKARAARR